MLTEPDSGYWMAKAYRIPATPDAGVQPGAKDFPTVPINRMRPRAFVTNLTEGAQVVARRPIYVRGLAMGGASGIAGVDLSIDGGRSWRPAPLGPDQGKYGFRLWEATLPALAPGDHRLLARCTNTAGEAQAMAPIWNPSGYMRSAIESIAIRAA